MKVKYENVAEAHYVFHLGKPSTTSLKFNRVKTGLKKRLLLLEWNY